MTDAYIYIRFSTPRQENGSSKERQLADCRDYVERMGWNEVEVIEDLGRSAWKGVHLKSGNLGKFAKRIENGEIPKGSVLVVEELDRLSRQKARITQRWIEDTCDSGIKIASVRGGRVYDSDNLTDNLMTIFEILMKAQAAWEYAERLSIRVKASYTSRMEQARANNTAITTQAPAWLEAVGKRPNVLFVPIPERVAVIREIFDRTIAGQAPWAIARAFNERSVPSFGKARWERTYIVNILRSAAIEGDFVVGEGKNSSPTGEVLHGYFPVIIEPETVGQARAMLNRRRRGSGRNSGVINNLFGQKIRCGHCHGRMMTTGYQSRYLVCYDANRGNVCKHTSTYKYRPFEKAALDEVLHLALDETFFRQAQKSNFLTVEIASVEKAIRDKQAEAARLVALLSRIESPTTEQTLSMVEATLKTLNTKLKSLQRDMEAADGVANAQAHLSRVHGVREALTHADDAIRLPARLRVSEALQHAIDYIGCGTPHHDRKAISLAMIGGAHLVTFDNEGNEVHALRPNDYGADRKKIIGFTTDPAFAKRVDDYLRRAKA